PVRKPSALDFQPIPSAVTIPAPVMTTRGCTVERAARGKSMNSVYRRRISIFYVRVRGRPRLATNLQDLSPKLNTEKPFPQMASHQRGAKPSLIDEILCPLRYWLCLSQKKVGIGQYRRSTLSLAPRL